jgi:hypothetical protein
MTMTDNVTELPRSKKLMPVMPVDWSVNADRLKKMQNEIYALSVRLETQAGDFHRLMKKHLADMRAKGKGDPPGTDGTIHVDIRPSQVAPRMLAGCAGAVELRRRTPWEGDPGRLVL